MDFLQIAINKAKRIKRLAKLSEENELIQSDRGFLYKRHERLYRRLSDYVKDFNGVALLSNHKIQVENYGSPSMSPCIRFYEAMEYEKIALINIFTEITDDGEQSRVQCRAECLWVDPVIRLVSGDSDKLMLHLAKQIATIIKVS